MKKCPHLVSWIIFRYPITRYIIKNYDIQLVTLWINILLTSSNNQISEFQIRNIYLLDQTVGRDILQFIYWNHATFSNSF